MSRARGDLSPSCSVARPAFCCSTNTSNACCGKASLAAASSMAQRAVYAAWTHAAWPGGGLKCHLLIRPDYEAYRPKHKYTIALPSLTCSLICLPPLFSQANNSCRLHWQFILAQPALLRHWRRPKDLAALTCLVTAMTPYCDLWNVNAWRSGTHTGPKMHVTRLGWNEKLN